VTYPVDADVDVARTVTATRHCADALTRRLGGRPTAAPPG
jgi:hypothetical protein